MPFSRKKIKLSERFWGDVRNAIARDNREMPIRQLEQAIAIRQPIIDAVVSLPEGFLRLLHEHSQRGTLTTVLHDALADMPPPSPPSLMDIDLDNIPVIDLVGEGMGERISLEEGLQRLREAAKDISLDERLGHLCDAEKIEQLLGIPRKSLLSWHKRSLIVGFKDDQGKYLFPLEQFVDAKPVEGLGEVLQIIRHPHSAWTWLLRAKPSINGVPLDLIKKGRLYDVLEAADRDFGPI